MLRICFERKEELVTAQGNVGLYFNDVEGSLYILHNMNVSIKQNVIYGYIFIYYIFDIS